MKQKYSYKKAFTLAEVLVTLVVIGVISALVIPSYRNSAENMEYRAALKKAISSINQALLAHYAHTNLSVNDYTSADSLVSEVFKKQMGIIKGKDTFTSDDCSGSVFTVEDGMIYCISNFKSENSNTKGSVCDFHNTIPCIASEGPNLWIDVNGERNPNTLTTSYLRPKDIYTAQIYSQKIVLYGDAAQQIMSERTASNK